MDLIGVWTLKIIYVASLGGVFDSLTKKCKVFKSLSISDISEFSLWVLEPNQKDGNEVKFRKPNFNDK